MMKAVPDRLCCGPELPLLARLSDDYVGPNPTFRWGPLQAITWIATRDLRWVKGLYVWIGRARPGMYWGEGPNVAAQARDVLRHELHQADEPNGILSSYSSASGALLEAIGNGLPCLDARNDPVVLSKIGVFGFVFPGGDDVGVEVASREPERWGRIAFEAGEIMRRWPSLVVLAEQSGSGDPGRPEKSASLYMAEFNQRVGDGTAFPGLKDEAKALLNWLVSEHPNAKRPTVATISNRIRERHREYRRG